MKLLLSCFPKWTLFVEFQKVMAAHEIKTISLNGLFKKAAKHPLEIFPNRFMLPEERNRFILKRVFKELEQVDLTNTVIYFVAELLNRYIPFEVYMVVEESRDYFTECKLFWFEMPFSFQLSLIEELIDNGEVCNVLDFPYQAFCWRTGVTEAMDESLKTYIFESSMEEIIDALKRHKYLFPSEEILYGYAKCIQEDLNNADITINSDGKIAAVPLKFEVLKDVMTFIKVSTKEEFAEKAKIIIKEKTEK